MARGAKDKTVTEKPDAAATRYCDVCEEDVNVGLGGDRNFDMHINSSKKHKQIAAKRAVQGTTTLKKTLMTKWFTPKAKPSPGSNSTASSSTPTQAVHSLKPVTAASTTLSPTVIDVDLEDLITASAVPETSAASALIQRLQTLTATLPSHIPIAAPNDTLAVFSSDPRASADEGDSPDDIYEKVINRTLDNRIGNEKQVVEVSLLIRRGPLGMDGFCRWIELCLIELSISPGLLERRVGRVCDAMKLLGAKEHLDPPVPAPKAPKHPSGLAVVTPKLCKGFVLEIEGSPWTSYPFGLHPHLDLPWSVFVSDEKLVLRSLRCMNKCSTQGGPCDECASLGKLTVLNNILERIAHGPHKNASWKFYTVENMVDLLHSKTAQVTTLRLTQLNLQQSLLVRAKHLEAFKRFLFAVAKDDVPRLHSLVATMIKDGAAIFAILSKISMASNQLYSPKSYADAEYKQLFLFHKLGGRAVAELAHRTHGLPSIDATRRYMRATPLFPSSKLPTKDEMLSNLEISYPPRTAESKPRPIQGFQLMADEIKIESRLRWDARTNKILGVCREHSGHLSMDFESIAEPDAIIERISEKECHFASEATVMAISHFSDTPQAYCAHPFVVSGSCKQEDAPAQKTLLEIALNILASDRRDDIGGRLYCITSDGDAKRRRATAQLTLIADLDPADPIRTKLGELRLFNFKCGRDAVTSDIEYKHLLKRLRSALLRTAGCQINGRLINRDILRQHLQSTGIPKHRIDAITSPEDKQDVKLMYDLLSAVAVLPDATDTDKPTVHNTRKALQLLGKLYAHLLEVYINVDLSLRHQLQHLSAASHLMMAIYQCDRGNSMPSVTYFDMQTTIKNAYFCVAKAQVDDPDGSFWLILIGTDALERLFGTIRTMIGADSNCDHLQLANRVESAAICSQILAENPSWERAARRLTLKTWHHEAGSISARVDHINPASWEGDVKVKSVVLLTCWEEGRRTATTELKSVGYAVPFEDMDNGDGFDMFCPFGQNNMVLLGRPTEGEREEDEEEIAFNIESRSTYGQPVTEANEPVPTRASETNVDAPTIGVVLEELATQELSRLSATTPPATKPKHEAYVLVNSSTGRSVQQHKSSVCRVYSEPLTVRDSHARLERVRGYPRHIAASGQATAFGVEAGSPAEPTLAIQDPAAVLVRSKGLVWLAIVEIYGIKQGAVALDRLPVRLLVAPNIHLTVRITSVSSRPATQEDTDDWEWFGSFEKSTFEVDGKYIQVLDPPIINTASKDGVSLAGYAYKSAELVMIATHLYGKFRDNLNHLEDVPWTDTFPYRLIDGARCFVCENDASSRGTIQMQHRCPMCPSLPLTLRPPGKLVEHIAQHILYDSVVKARSYPCGFCGGSGDLCAVYLGKGKGRNGAIFVDVKKSRCKNGNLVKLSIGSGIKSTMSSPSTNHPITCPICAASNPLSPAIWKYNLRAHIEHVHSEANVDAPMYKDLYAIDRLEVTALRNLWEKKTRAAVQTIQSEALNISDAHCARLSANDDVSGSPAVSHVPDIGTTESMPGDGHDSQIGEAITAPSSSKAQGKRRAMPVLPESSSDESEPGGHNDDSVNALIIGLPHLPSGSDMEIPSPSTRFSSQSAMSSVIDLPSTFEAVPEANTAASALVFESVAQPTVLSVAMPIDNSNEPLSTRRATRKRAYAPVSKDTFCAEEDCPDKADVRPMITCAGPGCGSMFHLTCRGLSEVPAGGWYCDGNCAFTANASSRELKRFKKS